MSRVKQLAARIPDERSAALITSAVSLRYLCGFPVDDGFMLVSKDESVLFVMGREYERVSRLAADFGVRVLESGKQLLDFLIKYSIKVIYTEADKLPVADFNVFKEQFHYAEMDTSLKLSHALLSLRSVKSDEELAAISTAQKICDKAYEKMLGTVRRGMSERQIASLLSFYLVDFGADEAGFPVRVLSGENTADFFALPSERQIRDGDFLILDFSAKYGGYCARMSRTVAVGEINPRRDNAYNAVTCAITDGLKALRAGIGGKVADSVARATLNAWGVDQYLVVGFAEGIGLELSELPFLGRDSTAMLKAKTALSVRVGVSVPERFGVIIGDMAVVTAEGCVDLTSASRSLVHI